MYLCKENSPACTPQIRPGTTIGHKIARLTPSCCVRAYGLPAKVNVSRRGGWKRGKVSRTVTVLLSVLQKWTWAFPISIKLATVSVKAQHPGATFTIKASFTDIRQDVSKEEHCIGWTEKDIEKRQRLPNNCFTVAHHMSACFVSTKMPLRVTNLERLTILESDI